MDAETVIEALVGHAQELVTNGELGVLVLVVEMLHDGTGKVAYGSNIDEIMLCPVLEEFLRHRNARNN